MSRRRITFLCCLYCAEIALGRTGGSAVGSLALLLLAVVVAVYAFIEVPSWSTGDALSRGGARYGGLHLGAWMYSKPETLSSD